MDSRHYDVLIVGAGIVGLALAHAYARRGYRVGVFEREGMSLMASIRNFGMVWPIGQPAGPALEMAMAGRRIWEDLSSAAGFWFDPVGSIHAAYREEEMAVLREFVARQPGRGEILDAFELKKRSLALREEALLGGIYSATEALVDPREAIRLIQEYLSAAMGVRFHFRTAVTHARSGWLEAAGDRYEAERIFVCSGADLRTLFPEIYRSLPLTTCKLQMMRTVPQPGPWRMGPPLCAGLTLLHYKSFAECPSLEALRSYYDQTAPEFARWGIHVMAVQNGLGEVIIGDSHQYGADHPPFDDGSINAAILGYLDEFVQLRDRSIAATWHGIYAKAVNGDPYVFHEVDRGLHILNGLGGAGMTLAFGLAESIAH
jgi:D-hydroxyproline dehydrogenase subunit beta